MKFNIEKDKCSACMACYNICPKKCISMQYDEYGILYPVIDEEKCTHCGLCNKVCQINQNLECPCIHMLVGVKIMKIE